MLAFKKNIKKAHKFNQLTKKIRNILTCLVGVAITPVAIKSITQNNNIEKSTLITLGSAMFAVTTIFQRCKRKSTNTLNNACVSFTTHNPVAHKQYTQNIENDEVSYLVFLGALGAGIASHTLLNTSFETLTFTSLGASASVETYRNILQQKNLKLIQQNLKKEHQTYLKNYLEKERT